MATRTHVHAQTLDLVDDPALIAEYEAHHRAVWPEVLAGLRAIGVRSMRIWRHGTRLFMVVETDEGFDPRRYQEYARDPRAREWDALMRRYQRRVPGAREDEWWATMEEVFDLGILPSNRGPGPAAIDADVDRVPGTDDNGPGVPKASQRDADGDPRGDSCDNRPTPFNATQAEGDGEGVGDACDPR